MYYDINHSIVKMQGVVMKNIQIKKDPDTDEFYLDMQDIHDYFEDPSIVAGYELLELEGGALSIKFYDKDGNHLKLKKE